jgi:glycosyltransferase involved in cell wall biosynthesis
MTAPHGVSVVLCCYNSAARLPETLRHLAEQSVPPDVPWEVVVVDNASTDGTAEAARLVWAALHSTVPFRVVGQPIAGLSAARDMGLEAAAFEFVLFCDDDNWLCPEYVRHVYELMAENPALGAVGGAGRAEGETALPAWFDRYHRYFAIGHQGAASGDITDAKGYLYGAGFAVRRSVLLAVKRIGFASRLTGRKGRALTGSDDLEICYLIRLAGFRLWFDSRLEFVHFMPSGRLRWPYFLALVEGTHRSRPYVEAFKRTLAGEADPDGSWRWLSESWGVVRRTVGRPKSLVSAMFAREGSQASVLLRQARGELAGWWTARSAYAALVRDVRRLREQLQAPAADDTA